MTGALVALTGVVALLARINRSGFAGCSGTAAFGWTIPVAGAAVIGVVAWILLHAEDDEPEERVGMSCRCSSCGEPVIDNWRLCPYCGMMVSGAPQPPLPEDAA